MGRPKKEKPTHSSGMYVYKATVGHNFDGSPVRKAFCGTPLFSYFFLIDV